MSEPSPHGSPDRGEDPLEREPPNWKLFPVLAIVMLTLLVLSYLLFGPSAAK